MDKKFIEAVRFDDAAGVREMIIETLTESPDSMATEEMITFAMDEIPELFAADDGLVLIADPEEWDEAYFAKAESDLRNNFSRDKLVHFQKVSSKLSGNRPMQSDIKESLSEDEIHMSRREAQPSPAMGKLGYVLMFIGAAGAITGLFVPVKFLLGLSIGVMMLGIAVVYMNIRKD